MPASAIVALKPSRVSAGDRRAQILEVAASLFAAQGFSGTTTRQVATAAGVSEAIIFRHFPTKDDLYWAVLQEWIGRSGGRAALQKSVASGASDRDILTQIAIEMLERRSRDTTLTRLFLYSALENHRLAERFFREHVAAYYEPLAAFIRQRIKSGTFRQVNPLLAARGFLGMVIYHSWVQEIFGGKRYQQFSHAEVSEALVDVWLAGMLRRPAEANRTVRSSNGRASNVIPATLVNSKRKSGSRRVPPTPV